MIKTFFTLKTYPVTKLITLAFVALLFLVPLFYLKFLLLDYLYDLYLRIGNGNPLFFYLIGITLFSIAILVSFIVEYRVAKRLKSNEG